MSNTTKKQLIIITIGSFLSYLLFGLFDSLKGPILPHLLEDVGFNYSLGGTIIMGQYAGYFAATLLTGMAADYFGRKVTLIAAGICLIFGVIGYSLSVGLLPMVFFIIFIGLGLGSLELCGCNIIAEIYQSKKGRYLNILTAIAGIGAIISPAIAGYLLNEDVSWRLVYRYGLIIAIPITVYFIVMNYPFDNAKRCTQCKLPKQSLRTILLHRKILFMYLVNFSYMAAEIGMATWLVDFYRNVKHYSVVKSSACLSFFFISMTLGRILGSFFVDKIGHIKSILIASSFAFLCILLGVFGPGSLSILIALTGLFYSIIFPTAAAVISDISPQNTGRALGIHFACGGLGGMAGPWLVGLANDALGLQWGMALNCIFCIGIIVPAWILNKK